MTRIANENLRRDLAALAAAELESAHGIEVEEYGADEFEHVVLASKHDRPTIEEYKASLPDYNPGEVYIASPREVARYQSDPESYRNRPVTAGAVRAAGGAK